MITFFVLEDEQKIAELISRILRSEGYSFFDEPQSRGLIKIIKRSGDSEGNNSKPSSFDPFLLGQNSGDLYKVTVEDMEKSLISSVLERTEGNQLKAAKILGINRNTLRTKIKKLGIKAEY
ncbi:MAG: helix-turn-helix domain-containing protein [Candidatus Omnitrophota bacterium]|jgi:DNA-binding NtrC family response regulator